MSSRFIGLDLARTLALVAMIATHTLPLRDTVMGSAEDSATWVGLLFAGRASVLFAVLAGAALVLMANKSLTYLWSRSALLIVLGFFLDLLNTPVLIILGPLGLTMALTAPLRRLDYRALLLIAAGWLAVAPWLQWWLAQNVLSGLNVPYSWDAYPVVVWLAYTVLGAALMSWVKQRSLTERPSVLVVTGLVAAAVAAVLWWVGRAAVLALPQQWEARLMVGTYPRLLPGTPVPQPIISVEGYPWLLTPHSAAPVAVWQHALMAAAVMLLLLAATGWFARHSKNPVLAIAAGAGRWSLTTYSVHIVVVSVLLYVDPLHTLLSQAGKALVNYTVVLIIGLLAAKIARGPLESVVAKVATFVAGKVSELGASSSGPGGGPPPHRKQ